MEVYGRFYASGEIFEGFFEVDGREMNFEGLKFSLNAVKFLPPVKPSKLICIGVNYKEHAEEFGKEIPDDPIIFMKPESAVIGDSDPIILPPQSQRVDYEGELAVVISKRCKDVSYDEVEEFILGYTCFNDVTARDLQFKDGQWTRGKSFDTFAPIGPYVVLSNQLNPDNLKIETFLNGEVVQSSNTSNMAFNAFRLVEFISSIMTLKKGDVIATGTPSGVGALKPGDEIEVRIEGIGSLRNPVIAKQE
ncbi:2-hydroxyhepta-2,4-diene-1,7-dioate isomerase [Archaeoglobales archaeon]|nr:MAG: 2-hydroxyhepta-2,4-diene-1,7-dioate isomerase [Archaeoglobales archaeon]